MLISKLKKPIRSFAGPTVAVFVLFLIFAPVTAEATAAEALARGAGWLLGGLGDVGLDIIGGVLTPVVWILFQIMSLIVGLSGVLLNSVIQTTVVEMAKNFSSIEVIDTTWAVVRDVANIGFIFILLYSAISTIIGKGGDNKRLVVNVVIAAILINFSLFATKAIIDASNLLALLFYSAIAPGATANGVDAGISNSLMEILRLQTLFNVGDGAFDGSTVLIVGLLGSVILLISAFSFFAVAIMFVIRYVALIFTLILSPLAFASLAIPQLRKVAGQWWSTLSGQAFFAPIYFFMIWISLRVTEGLVASNTFGTGDWAAALGATVTNKDGMTISNYDPGTIGLIIQFAVIIAFILASLIYAKEQSNKSGAIVSNLTKWATGQAGKATFGVAGRVGRGTIGRVGSAIGDSETLKKMASNEDSVVSRFAGRWALKGGRAVGRQSFDVRGSGLGGTLDAGKPSGKGGFAKYQEEKAKEEAKFAASLAPSKETEKQAEKDLINHQGGDKKTTTKIEGERVRERKIRYNRLNKLTERELEMAAEGASEYERQKIRKEIELAQSRYEATRDTDTYAKARVDEIKGVKNVEEQKKKDVEDRPEEKAVKELSENIAKEREVLVALNEEIAQLKDNIQELELGPKSPEAEAKKEVLSGDLVRKREQLDIVTEHLSPIIAKMEKDLEERKKKSSEAKSRIENEYDRKKAAGVFDGAGDRRKRAHADVVENSVWAAIAGYNKAAAEKIRKGKSDEEQFTELAKKIAQKEEEEKKKKEEEEKPEEKKS